MSSSSSTPPESSVTEASTWSAFLKGLWEAIFDSLKVTLALYVVFAALLCAFVLMLLSSRSGDAGPGTAVTSIALGIIGFAVATWRAHRIEKYVRSAARALWTSLYMVALAAVLALQLGLVIYAGRNSWDVRDASTCAVPRAGATLDLTTCRPVGRWDSSMLVVWHLVDAAPLSHMTEVTKWSPPAVYGSSWVGILLVYAEALFVLPLIVLVKNVWDAITDARTKNK